MTNSHLKYVRFNKMSVSFSGGRSSGMMVDLVQKYYSPHMEVKFLFANTGCEHPATYEFIQRCDEFFGLNLVILEGEADPEEGKGMRFKQVNASDMNMTGAPFESYIKKYGIPNQTNISCTGRLKVDVMNRYLRQHGFNTGKNLNYHTAIGIRYDEMDRVSPHAERAGLLYPLVREKITKQSVHNFWKKMPFDLNIPGDHYGNCVFCYKKSDRKLMTLALEAPEFFNFTQRMEDEWGHVKAENKAGKDGRRYFFRKHTSTQDLLYRALTEEFRRYSDQEVFDKFDPNLDLSGGCGESCEVYTDGPDADPEDWDERWLFKMLGGEE